MTLRALALVEAVRLLRHPIFLAGIALSVAMVAFYADGNGQLQTFLLMGGLQLPLAGATFAAASRNAGRSRRDGTEELFATLPRGVSTRTAAQLLAVLAAFPVATALVAVAHVAFGAGDGLVIDYFGERRVPVLVELVQGPLGVVTFGMLGVLVGRAAPATVVAPLLALAIVVAEIPLASWGPRTSLRWVMPLANDIVYDDSAWGACGPRMAELCGHVDGFAVTGMTWHLLYLLALAGAAAAAAVALRPRPVSAA